MLRKLYLRFIDDLSKAIAKSYLNLIEERKWEKQHHSEIVRAKAIAQIEAPDKVNDINYLKQRISNAN